MRRVALFHIFANLFMVLTEDSHLSAFVFNVLPYIILVKAYEENLASEVCGWKKSILIAFSDLCMFFDITPNLNK